MNFEKIKKIYNSDKFKKGIAGFLAIALAIHLSASADATQEETASTISNIDSTLTIPTSTEQDESLEIAKTSNPVQTPEPTQAPDSVQTPEVNESGTPSASPIPTQSPDVAQSASPIPTQSPDVAQSASPILTQSPDISQSASPTPSQSPEASPSVSPTPSQSPEPVRLTLEELGIELQYALGEENENTSTRELTVLANLRNDTLAKDVEIIIYKDETLLEKNSKGNYDVNDKDELDVQILYTLIDAKEINLLDENSQEVLNDKLNSEEYIVNEKYVVDFSAFPSIETLELPENELEIVREGSGEVAVVFHLDGVGIADNSRILLLTVSKLTEGNISLAKEILSVDIEPSQGNQADVINPEPLLGDITTAQVEATKGATYDVIVTYLDKDGVTSTQTFSEIVLVSDALNYIYTKVDGNNDGDTTDTDTDYVILNSYRDPAPKDIAIIPSFIDNIPVKEIGANAFEGRSIQAIEFEENSQIEIIGVKAFFNNPLKSITLPDSVTTINANAFQDNKMLTSINLPSNLITIGDYAFSNAGIDSTGFDISIPATVTSIGKYAFSSSALKNLSFETKIVDGKKTTDLRTINDYAFSSSHVIEANIPEGVTKIGSYAFYNTYSLSKVTIPTTVKIIYTYSFGRTLDTGLARSKVELHLHNGITTLSQHSFTNSLISEFNYIDTNAEYIAEWGIEPYVYINKDVIESDKKYRLPESVTTIGYYAFARTSFTKLIYPYNVNTVTGYFRCESLKTLIIEEYEVDGVLKGASGVSIGGYWNTKPFNYLTEIYLPSNTIKNLTNTMIPGAVNLEIVASYADYIDIYKDNNTQRKEEITGKLYIPYSVETISKANFNSPNFTEVHIGDEVNGTNIKSIAETEFTLGGARLDVFRIYANSTKEDGTPLLLNASWGAVVQNITYNDIVVVEGDYDEDGLIEKYTIALNSGEIQYYDTQSEDKEITIPNSVIINGQEVEIKKLSGTAFTQNKTIEKVVFSDDSQITTIELSTFEGASALREVVIGDSIVSIGREAFKSTSSLKTISFGKNVNFIGEYAFEWSGVEVVEFAAADENSPLYNGYELFLSSRAFRECRSLTDVIVNKTGLVGAGAVLFERGGRNPNQAEINFTIMTEVSPAFSSVMFQYYFNTNYWNNIYVVNLPNLKDSEDKSVFPWGYTNYHNEGLVNLNVFYEDTYEVDIDGNGLSDGLFNTSTNTIQKYVGDAGNLTSITIPEYFEIEGQQYPVLSLGVKSFSSTLSKLVTVRTPVNLKSIGTNAFYLLKNLQAIELHKNLTYIGAGAFSNSPNLQSSSIVNNAPANTTFEIPTSVTNIGIVAFSANNKIQNLITSVATNRSFESMYALKNVSFNRQVTAISTQAFQKCTSLENVVWPEGLKTIGDYAFYQSDLRSIVLPEGVTTVSQYAFYTEDPTHYLTQVSIPTTITAIGVKAFASSNTGLVLGVPSAVIEQVFIPEQLASNKNISIKTDAFNNRFIENIYVEHPSEGAYTNSVGAMGAKDPNSLNLSGETPRNYEGEYASFKHETKLVLGSYERLVEVFAEVASVTSVSRSEITKIQEPSNVFINNTTQSADSVTDTAGLFYENGTEVNGNITNYTTSDKVYYWPNAGASDVMKYTLKPTDTATHTYSFDFYASTNSGTVKYSVYVGKIGVPEFTQRDSEDQDFNITNVELSQEEVNSLLTVTLDELENSLLEKINPLAKTEEFPNTGTGLYYSEDGEGTFAISDEDLQNVKDKLENASAGTAIPVNVVTTSGTGFTANLAVNITRVLKPYDFTFDYNYEKAPSNIVIENIIEGTKISEEQDLIDQIPTGLTREGFVFGGWHTLKNSSSLNKQVDFESYIAPNYDITFYAKWNPLVTFKVEGESDVSIDNNAGELVEVPSDVLKSVKDYTNNNDLTFAGWTLEDGTLWETTTSLMPNEPITLTAQFIEKDVIVFKVVGGAWNEDVSDNKNIEQKLEFEESESGENLTASLDVPKGMIADVENGYLQDGGEWYYENEEGILTKLTSNSGNPPEVITKLNHYDDLNVPQVYVYMFSLRNQTIEFDERDESSTGEEFNKASKTIPYGTRIDILLAGGTFDGNPYGDENENLQFVKENYIFSNSSEIENPTKINAVFVGWTWKEAENGQITLTANYLTDKIGNGFEPDGIADRFQAVIYYNIENGLWNDLSDERIIEVITFRDSSNKLSSEKGAEANLNYTPVEMKADANHSQHTGEWFENSATGESISIPTKITKASDGDISSMTPFKNYVHSFTEKVTIEYYTFDEDLGKLVIEDAKIDYGSSITINLNGGTSNQMTEGTIVTDFNNLILNYTGNNMLENLTKDLSVFMGWELTENSINENGPDTYTLNAIFEDDILGEGEIIDGIPSINQSDNVPDKYQAIIQFDIENGAWADGKTQTIQKIITFYNENDGWSNEDDAKGKITGVPTGMKANSGFENGKWDIAVSEDIEIEYSKLTAENEDGIKLKEYLYSFSEIFIPTTEDNTQPTPTPSAVPVPTVAPIPTQEPIESQEESQQPSETEQPESSPTPEIDRPVIELEDGELPPPPIQPENQETPKIEVSGTELSPEDFTINETGIVFSEDFLSTLPDGEHKITMQVGEEIFETSVIVENGVPLSAYQWVEGDIWSVFNLISVVILIISAVVYLLISKKKQDENDKIDEEMKKKYATKKKRHLITLIFIALISTVLLFITQDFTNPMGLFDEYSLVFSILFVSDLLVIILSKTKKEIVH